MTTEGDLRARRDHVFGRGMQLFYDEPLQLVRGEGVYVYDADGRRYLDLYNNVPCVGHAHPRVVDAVSKQLATLNTHSRYLHEGVVAYAERLVGRHHPALDRVVFCCTGSEANEIAVDMARRATGGRGIICTSHAYHGNTALLRRLTLAGGRRDTEVRAIAFPQRYRPARDGLTDDELREVYLDELRGAIDSLAAAGVPLACLIVCPLFANEGLPDLPPGYLPAAAETVRDAGGVVISDEVQAGFVRSGDWWGYQAQGFVPDIATMGKPMGAGVPLAGVVAPVDLVERFRERTLYFNTFAASPLQAAAGSAVLDVIDDEDLHTNVNDVGRYLRAALARIDSPHIGDVRGHGLFIAVDWVTDRETKTPDAAGAQRVANRLRERGFLVESAGLEHFNLIKIRPPLVFGRDHAVAFLDGFDQTVREVARR